MTAADRNTSFLAEVARADHARAVAVIQSGLIARGHDLGPTGADEDAGPLTLAAWRAEAAVPVRGPVSADSIAAVLGAVAPRLVDSEIADWARWLAAAAERYDIATPARIAAWLAQLAHESSGFQRLEENLNYTAERLMAVWPRRFPTRASAEPYAHNPAVLAKKVYGDRIGNDRPSDGYTYRGRGLIQLTGRANYAAAPNAGSVALVDVPELAKEPPVAAMIAGWYWQSRGCNELADAGDFDGVTRKIAGALTGISDRRRLWELAKRALEVE